MSVIKEELDQDKTSKKTLYFAEYPEDERYRYDELTGYDPRVPGGSYTYDEKVPYDDPNTPKVEYNPESFPSQADWFMNKSGTEGSVYGVYGENEVKAALEDFKKTLQPGEEFDVVLSGHAGDYGQFSGIDPSRWSELMDQSGLGGDRVDDVMLHSCYMGDNELACGMLANEFDAPVHAQTVHKWGTGAIPEDVLADPNASTVDKSFVQGAGVETYNPGWGDTINKMVDEQTDGGVSYAVRGANEGFVDYNEPGPLTSAPYTEVEDPSGMLALSDDPGYGAIERDLEDFGERWPDVDLSDYRYEGVHGEGIWTDRPKRTLTTETNPFIADMDNYESEQVKMKAMYLLKQGWTEDAVKNYIDVAAQNTKGDYVRGINESLDSVYNELERKKKRENYFKNYYKREGRFQN